MAAPTPIPRNPDNSIQDLRWANPSGVIIEPSTGRKDGGWQPLDQMTEGEMNWIDSKPLEAGRALISQCVPSSSGLIGSWIYRGPSTPLANNGTWSDAGQPPLNGFLSDNAGVNTVTVDLWLDPDGNGATGLQVRQSSAVPFLFTSTRDHYFFVDLTQSIASVGAGMTVVDVPVGDPQPATPAGTVPVWRVETDAVGIVDQEILIPSLPTLKTVGAEDLVVNDLTVTGMIDTVDLNVTNNASINELTLKSGGFVEITNGSNLFLRTGSTATVEPGVTFNWSDNTTTFGTSNGNTWTVNGNVTLGTDGASVHTMNGNLTGANSTVSLPGGTLAASNVNASSLAPTVTNYPTQARSSTNGRATFDGRVLAVGDGTNQRVVRSPSRGPYVASATTGAASDDLGSTISMDIADDEFIYITLSALQECDTALDVPRLFIAASNGVDSVSILNTGDDDVAQSLLPQTVSGGDSRPNGFTVRWKPTNDVGVPNNTSWTLTARHGVSGAGGGDVKSKMVRFEAEYA